MKRNYKGWAVYGSDDYWYALRHGVRMRANSETHIIAMIECQDDPWAIFAYEKVVEPWLRKRGL